VLCCVTHLMSNTFFSLSLQRTQLTPNSFFGLSADLTDNRDVTLRMCLARTEGGRVQLGWSWLKSSAQWLTVQGSCCLCDKPFCFLRTRLCDYLAMCGFTSLRAVCDSTTATETVWMLSDSNRRHSQTLWRHVTWATREVCLWAVQADSLRGTNW